MTTNTPHIPVLVDDVLRLLEIQPNDVVLDGTLGFGGHASFILDQLGQGARYIGLDQDPVAIDFCQNKFSNESRVTICRSNFSDFDTQLDQLGVDQVDKVLLDLGMSSFHLDSSGRGFSFQKEEPLDMRMNPDTKVTASDILKTWSTQELSDLFYYEGDLTHNKQFVTAILEARRKSPKLLETTTGLVELVRTVFSGPRGVMIKRSSQVFQALRIGVNRERDVLVETLEKLLTRVKPGGRVAVITFHSGEDRLVKQFVKDHREQARKLTKHVIQAEQTEIKANSRSKPAKLRVFEIVS